MPSIRSTALPVRPPSVAMSEAPSRPEGPAMTGADSAHRLGGAISLLGRLLAASERSAATLETIRGQFGTALQRLSQSSARKALDEREDRQRQDDPFGLKGLFGKESPLGKFGGAFSAVVTSLLKIPDLIHGAQSRLAANAGDMGKELNARAQHYYEQRQGQAMLPDVAATSAKIITSADVQRSNMIAMARQIGYQAARDRYHVAGTVGQAASLTLHHPTTVTAGTVSLLHYGKQSASMSDSPAAPPPAAPSPPAAPPPPAAAPRVESAPRPSFKERLLRSAARGANVLARLVGGGELKMSRKTRPPAPPTPAAAGGAAGATRPDRPALGDNAEAMRDLLRDVRAHGVDWQERYARNLELLIRHEQHQMTGRLGILASQGNLADVKKQAQLSVLNADPLAQKEAEMARENLQLLKELLKAIREQNDLDRRKRGGIAP